jgi:tetratricopeptide (TPR) repeat protein
MDNEDWLEPAAMRLGQNGLATGNYELSIRAMDQLLEKNTDHIPGLMVRGSAYLHSRQSYEAALADFERLVELSPDRLDTYAPLASALLGLHRPEEALEVIEEARKRSREGDVGLGPNPDDAFWCGARASFASDAGNEVEASRILDECLETDPTSETLVTGAVEFYDRHGHGARSIEILKAAYAQAPESRSFRIGLVRRLHGLGESAEAEEILRAATAREDPAMAATAWADLARFLLQNGRTEAGVSAFETLLDLVATPAADVLFSYAEGLIAMGRYGDALEIARSTPAEVHRSMIRGRVEFARGEYDAALRELEQAMLLWPDSAPIRYYSALAAEHLGDFDRAVEEFRHAIRSDSNLLAARQRLARLHMAEGADRQALAILRYSASTDELVQDAESALLEIELLARLGKEVNVGGLPSSPDRSHAEMRSLALAAIARGAAHRGGPDATLGVLDEAGVIDPSDFSMLSALRLRIQALVELGRAAEATEIARGIVDAYPGNADYWALLGGALMESSESRVEARSCFERALEHEATNVAALTGLAEISATTGSLEEAVSLYSRAVEADPKARESLLGLVAVHAELGREAEGRAALESYLVMGDSYDGRAALRLARMLRSENTDRSLELARRALRFGAGDEAAKLVAALDRESAAGR